MPLLLTTQAVDKAIDELDWPRCGKCHMPVEDFRVTDTGTSLAFVIKCHNDERLVIIDDEIWDSVLGNHFTIGPVFVDEASDM